MTERTRDKTVVKMEQLAGQAEQSSHLPTGEEF